MTDGYSHFAFMDQYKKPGPDKNIRIGKAEIVYCHVRQRWQLPGGTGTRDEEKAYDMAFRIHDLLKGAV